LSYNTLTIPLRNDLPYYIFSITLSGVTYRLQLIFNGRMNRWIMNIFDASENQILSGIPVLILTNLTGQYRYLSVPSGIFIANDNTGQDMQPTQFSFGVTETLFYLDPGA